MLGRAREGRVVASAVSEGAFPTLERWLSVAVCEDVHQFRVVERDDAEDLVEDGVAE